MDEEHGSVKLGLGVSLVLAYLPHETADDLTTLLLQSLHQVFDTLNASMHRHLRPFALAIVPSSLGSLCSTDSSSFIHLRDLSNYDSFSGIQIDNRRGYRLQVFGPLLDLPIEEDQRAIDEGLLTVFRDLILLRVYRTLRTHVLMDVIGLGVVVVVTCRHGSELLRRRRLRSVYGCPCRQKNVL